MDLPGRGRDRGRGKSDAENSGKAPSAARKGLSNEEKAELFTAVLGNMSEGLVILDEDLNYVYINPASGKIVGHSPEEWLGERVGRYVHPDDRLKSHNAMLKALQGEPSSAEVRVMASDGRYRHLRLSYSTLVHREKVNLLVLISDVTRQKEAETELKRSEEQYRTLVEMPLAMIFTVDLKGTFLFVNSAFESVVGYTTAELHGMNAFQIAHPDEVAKLQQSLGHVVKGSTMHGVEVRVRSKCGNYIPTLVSGSPIVDKNGKVVAIVGVSFDITDLKRAEGELKKYQDHLEELVEERTKRLMAETESHRKADKEVLELRERLEYLLGATKTGVDIIDSEFNVLYVDPAWKRAYGEYEGRKCYDYFMGAKKPCPTCGIPKALKTRKKVVTEEVLVKENNRVIEVHTIPFQDERGEWLVAEFNIDVTERRKSEATLRESERMMKALFESSNDAILVADGETRRLTNCNPQAEELLGYTRDELLSMRADDLHPPDKVKYTMKGFRDQVERKINLLETEVLTKGGKRIPVEISTATAEIGGRTYLQGSFRDVSERKRAESLIRESERRYRELVEFISDVIFTLDFDGKVTFISPTITKLIGFTSKEIVGKRFSEFIFPEDLDRTEAEFARVIKNKAETLEIRILVRGGGCRWVNVNALLHKEGGETVGLIGTLTDVNERKRSETALRESEAKYRELVERANDGIVIVQDSVGVFYNDRILKMMGYSASEAGNLKIDVAISPGTRKQVMARHRDRLAGREVPSIYETKLLTKGGQELDVEINAGIITYGGKPAAMIMVRDISERKRSEELIRSITDNMLDVVCKIDELGNILYASPSVEKVFGYSAPEMMKKPFREHMHPEDLEAMNRMVAEMAGSPGSSTGNTEFRVMNAKGAYVWVEALGRLMLSGGKVTGALFGMRDITERKRAMAAVKESEVKLATIMDSMVDMVFGFDAEERIVFYHASTAKDLYVPPEQFLGKRLTDVLPPNVADGAAQAFRANREGSTYEYEYCLSGPQGTQWFSAKVSPIMIDGKYNGSVAVVRNITQSKKAIETIMESEERLNALFMASLDGIGVESNGVLVYANPALAKLYGYVKTVDIVGRKVASLVAPEDRERMSSYTRIRMAGEVAPSRYEFVGLRKDGSRIECEISASEYVIRGEKYILVFVRDVSQRKSQERETLRRQVLEAQFELKSVITDIVPIIVESLQREGKKAFIETLSKRLDKVLAERYEKGATPVTRKDVGEAYMTVLRDLGGRSHCDCPQKKVCTVTVTACPWDNQVGKNLILCILCRGIAWRFATEAKPSLAVTLKETMADGKPECKLLIETTGEKD